MIYKFIDVFTSIFNSLLFKIIVIIFAIIVCIASGIIFLIKYNNMHDFVTDVVTVKITDKYESMNFFGVIGKGGHYEYTYYFTFDCDNEEHIEEVGHRTYCSYNKGDYIDIDRTKIYRIGNNRNQRKLVKTLYSCK